MDDDVRAVFNRAAERGARHGIVHDQRHARRMGDVGNRRDVQHHAAGVGEAFDEHAARLVGDRRGDGGRIVRVDEHGLPAELGEAVRELVERAAVELLGGHDLAARLHQGVEHDELRGMA